VEKVTWARASFGETITPPITSRERRPHIVSGDKWRPFTRRTTSADPALASLPVRLGWIDMMMDDVHEYWRASLVLAVHRLVQPDGPAADGIAAGEGRWRIPGLRAARRALR